MFFKGLEICRHYEKILDDIDVHIIVLVFTCELRGTFSPINKAVTRLTVVTAVMMGVLNVSKIISLFKVLLSYYRQLYRMKELEKMKRKTKSYRGGYSGK